MAISDVQEAIAAISVNLESSDQSVERLNNVLDFIGGLQAQLLHSGLAYPDIDNAEELIREVVHTERTQGAIYRSVIAHLEMLMGEN